MNGVDNVSWEERLKNRGEGGGVGGVERGKGGRTTFRLKIN